jgi:hypothetical protein
VLLERFGIALTAEELDLLRARWPAQPSGDRAG